MGGLKAPFDLTDHFAPVVNRKGGSSVNGVATGGGRNGVEIDVKGSDRGPSSEKSLYSAYEPRSLLGLLSGEEKKGGKPGVYRFLHLLHKLDVTHASLYRSCLARCNS